MGRKSKLTEEQWKDIERRHLLDGEPVLKLAKEFGVDESSIRKRINPKNPDSAGKSERAAKIAPNLKEIAARKVAADEEQKSVMNQIATLPYQQQAIVSDLAATLIAISTHLSKAAEYGAATSHRLSAIANGQMDQVDDADPLKSVVALQTVAMLMKIANGSAEVGLKLLAANKEAVDDINKPKKLDVPAGLGHFYGEED